MRTRVEILGTPIDNVRLTEAVELLASFARSASQHHVMTPNPEMLVEAKRNPEFRDLLRRTDLNLPDGAGLLWAAKRQGTPLSERVTGVDAVEAFALRPDAPPIFLLGAAPGMAERAARRLQEKNPKLEIAGTFGGSPHVNDVDEILKRVNASEAPVLFVAFGAPKQDLWIAEHLEKMPSVKLAMGVGGALDFLAGRRTRAPMWMRSLKLEWLWRLIKQPSRCFRIFKAVVVFPYLVLTEQPPAPRHGASRM
jgi:N-acetylglucosaminyldiphosphoundecaprenol N-acetyl-beta-D-mannosaminyltransferase